MIHTTESRDSSLGVMGERSVCTSDCTFVCPWVEVPFPLCVFAIFSLSTLEIRR